MLISPMQSSLAAPSILGGITDNNSHHPLCPVLSTWHPIKNFPTGRVDNISYDSLKVTNNSSLDTIVFIYIENTCCK